jgi:lipopolysaccharide export system protein LptA
VTGETLQFVRASRVLPSSYPKISPDGIILYLDKILEINWNTSQNSKSQITIMPCYKLPRFQMRRFGFALMLPAALFGGMSIDNPVHSSAFPMQLQAATAQQTPAANRPLTIRSDVQEYDAKTQVITARGNVQMVYPSRQIQATSAQAQYFSKERRIDFSGNVYILQQGGNSIRAEKVTYLIDEGRFVALPQSNRQVESIYMVQEANDANQAGTSAPAPAPATPTFRRSN